MRSLPPTAANGAAHHAPPAACHGAASTPPGLPQASALAAPSRADVGREIVARDLFLSPAAHLDV